MSGAFFFSPTAERGIFVLAFAFVVALTAVAYFPGLDGPFVFDDLTNIVHVPGIRLTELDREALHEALLAVPQQGPFGRPLAYLSFGLNYYFSGLHPYYFKATNVVIHLLTAATLLFLAVSLSRRLRHGTAITSPLNHYGPVIVFSIWALHPINLTSVLYVVQRMTSLSALFIVLGLLGFVYGRERLIAGSVVGFPIILTSLSVFGALATLTKENGVLIFAYALVIELTCYRFASAPNLERTARYFLWALFAIPAVVALGAIAIKFEKMAGTTAYASRPFDLYERLLTEARAIWLYLRLIALPDLTMLGLYHDDFAISRSITSPWLTLPAVIGIAALATLALVALRFAPALAFGLLWFFLGHSIESTALPLELVHEHRNYLPSFGPILAAAYYATHPKLLSRIKPLLIYGFFALYVGLLGSATHARARHWSSEWDLYTTEARNHPNSARAHTMLGILYHDNKLYPAAEYEFQQAAALNPESADPLIRLAHHQFVARQTIEPQIMDELERRLTMLPLNSVTLWVIDPLIKVTVKNADINKKLLRMYTKTLKRQNINIAADSLATAASNIGLAYTKHHDWKSAADLYSFAMRLAPKPSYAISLGEAEFERGDIAAAKKALFTLYGASLANEDVDRLKRLERRLQTTSRSQ